MDLARWFEGQLRTSADGFAWSVEQVANERRYAQPPGPPGGLLGEWSVARHAFHLLYYEQYAALPILQHWPQQPFLSFAGYRDQEASAWAAAPALETIVEEFRARRAEHNALLLHVSEAAWEEAPATAWGHETLRWIVTKTYQHTLEHTNNILQIALFWDRVALRNHRTEEQKQQGATTPSSS